MGKPHVGVLLLLMFSCASLYRFAQARDTRNSLAKAIYGCSFHFVEDNWTTLDLLKVGWDDSLIKTMVGDYVFAKLSSTGAIHAVLHAIIAGEPSDGSFYSDNTKGIVSPMSLFKMPLQIALTRLCGADINQAAFEAVPGAGILWRVIGWTRLLKGLHRAAVFFQEAPWAVVQRLGKFLDRLVSKPYRSASDLGDQLGEKCKTIDKYYKYALVLTRALTMLQYGGMFFDYLLFPSVSRIGCEQANNNLVWQAALYKDRFGHDYQPGSKAPQSAYHDYDYLAGVRPRTGRHLLTEPDGNSPFNSTLSQHARRSLQQTVGWDVSAAIKDLEFDIDSLLSAMDANDVLYPMFKALKEVHDIGNAVLDIAHELESIVKAAHLEEVDHLLDQAESLVATVASALKPLGVVTPIFDAINDVMQFFTCPSFLSWACDLVSAIGDALESVLKSLGIPSIEDILQMLFKEIGFDFPDIGLPGLGIFDTAFSALMDPLTQKKDAIKAQAQALGQYLQPKSYFPAMASIGVTTMQTYLPDGVTAHYVDATNGASAKFDCSTLAANPGVTWYPVVKTATRTIWGCSQDMSAFIRFPCASINDVSCTVDYDTKYPSACKDDISGKEPFPAADIPDVLSSIGVGTSLADLGITDRFYSYYYCVRSDVNFDVLGELLTVKTDIVVEAAGSWDLSGASKKKIQHRLKSDNTILGSSNLTCGGDRVLFMEHSTEASARPPSVAQSTFFLAQQQYPGDAITSPWDYYLEYNYFNKYKVPYAANFQKGSDPCYDLAWLEFGTSDEQAYKHDLCGFLHSFDTTGGWRGAQFTGVAYDRMINELYAAQLPRGVTLSQFTVNMMWKCQGDGTVDTAQCVDYKDVPVGNVYPAWWDTWSGSAPGGHSGKYQAFPWTWYYGHGGDGTTDAQWNAAWNLMARSDPCPKLQWLNGQAMCTYFDWDLMLACHLYSYCDSSIYYQHRKGW